MLERAGNPSKRTHLCDERLCGSGNQVGDHTNGADDGVLLEARCREWLICREEGSVTTVTNKEICSQMYDVDEDRV
jgi:hypothetical protein